MSIDVSGGAGGTAAELDDLDVAASALDATSAAVASCAARSVRAGASPAVAAASVVVAVRAPHLAGTAAGAAAELERCALYLAGPAGASGEAVALGVLASTVRTVVRAYREADRAATALVADTQDAVMTEVGVAAPVLLVGLGVLAGAAAAAPPGRGAGPAQLAELLDAAGYRMPWLVEVVAAGSAGLLRGLATNPACAVVLAAAAARAGFAWPPRDEEQATAVLREVGTMVGALADRSTAAVSVSAVPRRPDISTHAPTGVAGLMTDAVDLGDPLDPGLVRVTQVFQPDGSSAWVVQLPGTQVWDLRPGKNPFDLSTDIDAMTGRVTLAAAGVSVALDNAMASAGRGGPVGRGDPVLLSGHSQGGILAAALACDPAFRADHPRLQVLTAGSPIAHFPIPPSVTVLSLEHVQDLVPRLDGRGNPDRPAWTTVRVDLRERGAPASAGASHGSAAYLTTAEAVDGAIATHASVSLDAWAAGAAAFLGAGRAAHVTDYRIERVPAGAAMPTGLVGAGR